MPHVFRHFCVQGADGACRLYVAEKDNLASIGPTDGRPSRPKIAQEILHAAGKMQKYVEENCDYVGDKFADEARAIHYGEAEERGIYGEATIDEATNLLAEDIPVNRIPWRRRTDSLTHVNNCIEARADQSFDLTA